MSPPPPPPPPWLSKKAIVEYDKESPLYLVYFPGEDKVGKYSCVKCTDALYAEPDVDDKIDKDVVLGGDEDNFMPRRDVKNPPVNQPVESGLVLR